jgi:hypothetical protein
MAQRDWQADWELTKRATPGPWYAIPHPEYKSAKWRVDTNPNASWANFGELAYMSAEDARFVAEAREALPYWLQRVKELEHVLEPLRYQDKEMLLKKIGDLKQTDGEDWAIGEVISRALEALEKGE